MTSASDICRAIKAKYSGPEWRTWFEVSQGTGASSGRRADAVVMNIWPSKDYQIHVFEVKVSRADFRQELADLSKSEAIGQYGDFFWLAAPAGLVAKDEVPEAWGLMELTKGGLRVKKQAPARANPAPLDRAFAASLLRSGEDLTEADISRRVAERLEAAKKSINAAVEERFSRQLATERDRNDRADAWRKEFEAAYGVRPSILRSATQMAERIRLAEQIGGGSVRQLSKSARALAELIDSIEANSSTEEGAA